MLAPQTPPKSIHYVRLSTIILAVIGAFASLAMVTLFFVAESMEKSYELEKLKEEVSAVSQNLDTVQESFNQIHAISHNFENLTSQRMVQATQLAKDISKELEYAQPMGIKSNNNEYLNLLSSPDEDQTLADRFEGLRVDSQMLAKKFRSFATVLNYNDGILKAIPSITPAEGWISSTFGPRNSPFTGEWVMHNGVDIGARTGSAVLAAADGIVLFSGFSDTLGKTVIIDHGMGIITKYAHNSMLLVEKGDQVARGDKISVVGSTGRSTGPHLHYEVVIDGKYVDPMNFLLDMPHDKLALANLADGMSGLGGETALRQSLYKKKENPLLFPIKLAMLSVAFALICLVTPAVKLRRDTKPGEFIAVTAYASPVVEKRRDRAVS